MWWLDNQKLTELCAEDVSLNYRAKTGEVFWWVKDLSAKPDHVSLVPETHMVEGEN